MDQRSIKFKWGFHGFRIHITAPFRFISPPSIPYTVNMSVRSNPNNRPTTQTLDFYRGLCAGVYNAVFAKSENLTNNRVNRGFRFLFPDLKLPEFQILDLTGSEYKVKTIRLDSKECFEQRKTYAYGYKRGGEQGRVPRTRKLSQKERLPYSVTDLVIRNGRRLYVNLRCSICGLERRIVITERNQGRNNPVCKHLKTEQEQRHGPQIYYIKDIKRQKIKRVKNA